MNSPFSAEPIRIALAGAGVWVRDAHLPSLLDLPDHFEIVAVYSRTADSAATMAEQASAATGRAVDVVTDFDALLRRDDVEAVDIVLPILVQPKYVEQALASGKHVLSEKPIAPDGEIARSLLTKHEAKDGKGEQVWMVGENYRYEAAYLKAEELIDGGAIGRVLMCDWIIYASIRPGNKYYETGWRNAGNLPGGFLLDGGVHQMAGLRLAMGEAQTVSAFADQFAPDLPPIDTLTASIRFESGALGTFQVTRAADAPGFGSLRIIGTDGSMTVERDRVLLTTYPNGNRSDADGQTEEIAVEGLQGVRNELVALAEAIRHGTPHRNTPQAAAKDLRLIEAMLESAARGEQVRV